MDKHLKKQFLESGLLDGIKTQEKLVKLLNELHASALEALLHGELEAHLDYAKHQKSNNTNARNGTTPKHIKTTFGKFLETKTVALNLLSYQNIKARLLL